MRINKKGEFGKLIIIVVKFTLNNVFFTVITKRGNVLFWVSCGSSGFKGPRRATVLAAEVTAKNLGNFLLKSGFNTIEVKFVSFFNSKCKAILKGFKGVYGLFLNNFYLKTPVFHNGLRNKKVRRV